ncbi:hypothetical protein BDQ12DRAFT_583916, partial [Crucibulum laeve]
LETQLICSCSAAIQLLCIGFFPASPLCPTLAVDVNMLDFVNELFVRGAPNNTAWCNALEEFLRQHKYQL